MLRAIDLALAAVIALVVIRLIDELAKGGWLGSPGLTTLAGASSCSQSLMRRMPFPYARSQRFKIVFQHFHDELFVARVTPAIAVDAADQHFTVVVDPDQRAIAVAAGLIAHSQFRNKDFRKAL